ncbi:MAG: SCO family protein [Pseudomonadota bacterium]
MKPLRIVLWSLVAVVAAVLGFTTIQRTMLAGENRPASFGVADIGGPFTAVSTNGETVTHEDLKGRPHALFFGFTHCPDVCPTTLYEASQWLAKMGDKADELDLYFVTVDPARDDRELLGEYLTAFDARITGITGTPEQVGEMARKWRVVAQKVPLEDGDYTMNHTATTFLMNADGSFSGTIAYGEESDTAVRKLSRLVERNS